MLVDGYQTAARSTAIFPNSCSVFYPALGLAGEIGELANKAKKLLRGDGALTEEKRADFCKELGDVLWYISGVASDLGLSLADIIRDATHQYSPEDSAENGGPDLYDVILMMARDAGNICEMAETIRHEGPNDRDRTNIRHRLICVLRGANLIAGILGTTLEQVSADNVAKLKGRQVRGTLKGDGDNR